MVPAHSDKVSRVSSYSGYCLVIFRFAYGTFTLFGRSFQDRSATVDKSITQSEPRNARISVWALPISLAATFGIDFSFFSSGYLDVSVHRVPGCTLCIHVQSLEVCSSRFPHSEIDGYLLLPAAFRSLSRLSSALSAKASTLRSSLLHQHTMHSVACMSCF